MPGLVLLLLLAACGWLRPKPPARPELAVVISQVPGPAAQAGEAAAQGARLAADDRYDVVVVDESAPDVVKKLVDNPNVAGVIAHTSAATTARMGPAWSSSGLPVLTLAAGEGSTLPRVVPDTLELSRCAVPLVTGSHVVLAYDGSNLGLTAASYLQGALAGRVVDVLGAGPSTLPTDAGRIAAKAPDELVYVGDLQLGGDLVRTMRVLKDPTPVLAVGLSAPDLAAAAGSDPGDVLVVSPDRPPLDPHLDDAWRARFGTSASGTGRTAYDAARLMAAAMDAAHADQPADAPLSREAVAAALRTLTVTGGGGPAALALSGGPTPILCTGYALKDDALIVTQAGRIGADGVAAAIPLPAQ